MSKTKVPFGSLSAHRVDGLVKYCGIVDGKEITLGTWQIIWTDVSCRKCENLLGDVPATMPRADLCVDCFNEFVNHACEVTPGELVQERLRGEW